jgi:two-component system, OmpR family, response regulator ChvI
MNKNKKILLVDDEPDITLTFSIVLEDNGFVVDAFNDPLLALSSLKQGLYVLALLDIKMPKMNGFELYREIRKLDDKVKVCFMTAFDIKKGDIEAAGILTLNEEKNPTVFRKPIKLEDLVSGVKAEIDN